MAIFTPETLRSALFPTFFFYQFLGMGIIEFPVGHQRWVFSFIYSSTICISYLILFFVSHDMLATISEYLGSSVASFAFSISGSINCLMIITNLVSIMFRKKKHNYCVTELMSIEKAITEMGAARSSQSSLRQKIWQLVGSLFVCFIMLISNYFRNVQSDENSGLFSSVLLSYVFDYPMLLSTFGDITFFVFNRAITHSFEDLNSMLQLMRITNPDSYQTRVGQLIRVEAILEDKNRLERLRNIRKIYFRLFKLAGCWAELNGLHVVASTIFAIWMGTFRIYNLWLMYFKPGLESQDLVNYLHIFKAIICHIVKLYLIVCSSSTLIVKARQTCGILLTDLQPIAFLRSEVDEFALQLIQNPLRLSAAGLFDLNYTLMHMVIANVATYLVVLIQTNHLSIATEPPSIYRVTD